MVEIIKIFTRAPEAFGGDGLETEMWPEAVGRLWTVCCIIFLFFERQRLLA